MAKQRPDSPCAGSASGPIAARSSPAIVAASGEPEGLSWCIGGELIGGIAVDMVAPERADFDGKTRVYLPLIQR